MRLVISTPHSRSRAVVWRSVIVSKPAKLKREHFALVVEQEQSACLRQPQPTTLV